MYRPPNTTCPDCNGEMEEGFLLDQTHGGRVPLSWIAGDVEKSIWTGTKIKGRARWELTAYRCPQCGLVKSYARTQLK